MAENDRNKPLLIVIAGPNGSGKTSLTHQLLKHEWLATCQYINPDDIAQNKFGDWNSKEAVMNAAVFATDLRNELLNKNIDFIFETVLSSPEKFDFLQLAKSKGYFIRLFFVPIRQVLRPNLISPI